MNKRKQIWDPLVRIFHWLLAISFITAYVVEDERLNLHLLAGSVVLGLIVFRLIWGVTGTVHARFASFTCSPREIRQHLLDLVRLRPADHLGHTPIGAVMIIVLLAGLLLLTLSGVALYGVENGSLSFSYLVTGLSSESVIALENIHAFVADGLVLLVLLHITGVMVESVLQKQNLIRAMITGYKTVKKEKV